jgi:hypothetical protein
VAEAALDALCAVASHPQARPALLAGGAVPAAAAAVVAGKGPEVIVRALMLLGMLAGSSPEGLIQVRGRQACLLGLQGTKGERRAGAAAAGRGRGGRPTLRPPPCPPARLRPRPQLADACDGHAAVRLLSLARQDADADIKVISRDLLGLLTRDPELKDRVEAAVRRAAAEMVAAAAAGRDGGAAAAAATAP